MENQRGSSTPVRLKLSVVNNTVDYGYINIEASTEVSSSYAQKAALINVSGNTIGRNNSAAVRVRYSNGGISMDSTILTVSNNNIQGRNSSGQGLYIESYSSGSNWTLNNNTIRSTNQGLNLYSERNSKFHVENNTVDSTYYSGIRKNNGNANIIGNTIEYCGKYYWNTDFAGVI
jgi:hypothetical protein